MLKEIKKELLTQDNRATRDPIFVVYDWEKIPTKSDYSDDWEYADCYDGYSALGNDKDCLLKFAKENEIKLLEEDLGEDDLFDFLEKEYNYCLMKNYYIKKRVFVNVFFTEKAAQRFIDQNHYHYSEPHIYVNCLWRNPEMVFVRDMLMGVNDGKT